MAQELVQECNRLRISLIYATQDAKQLSLQNRLSSRLLQQAQSKLKDVVSQAPKAANPAPVEADQVGSWMFGHWLPDPSLRSIVGDAELQFKRSESQRALATLSALLLKDISKEARVTAKILLSVVLRTCDRPCEALTHLEEAIPVADRSSMFDLIGKAQFHRGLCYNDMELFAEASLCFSLASGTKHHEERLGKLKEEAEAKRLAFPRNYPRRYVSPTFKVLCFKDELLFDGSSVN
ncbi:MAG: hypothetical protein M1833_005493 [Piccolia ochrophora]|nr:MAG: hypothetical protein M1833_005493 [Piccolia ochrophora]